MRRSTPGGSGRWAQAPRYRTEPLSLKAPGGHMFMQREKLRRAGEACTQERRGTEVQQGSVPQFAFMSIEQICKSRIEKSKCI